MKRLCVFYKDADKWLGRNVDWIVCQECQRRLRRGEWLRDGLAQLIDSIRSFGKLQ